MKNDTMKQLLIGFLLLVLVMFAFGCSKNEDENEVTNEGLLVNDSDDAISQADAEANADAETESDVESEDVTKEVEPEESDVEDDAGTDAETESVDEDSELAAENDNVTDVTEGVLPALQDTDKFHTGKCYDTDGGKEYSVRGEVKLQNGYVTSDTCSTNKATPNKLLEQYCNDKGYQLTESYNCEHGCKAGVCLSEEEAEETEPVVENNETSVE